MTITCKNCNQNFKGNFCNNCGQTANTHNLNFHFMWHDIQHGFFHFDKGIVYTAKQLFTRPGHAIREFIEGKRVKHFKPVSFVIILATVYGFLSHYFQINLLSGITGADSENNKALFEKFNEWVANHFALSTLLTIPFGALGSYLAFKKQGYNFIEHLVLNTFLAGQKLLVHLFTFPLMYWYNDSEHWQVLLSGFTFIDILLLFWGYSQFFNKLPKSKSLTLTLLSYLIFWVFMVIIGTLVQVIIKGIAG